MRNENRLYVSKDGSRYNTPYDAQAADTRYDQQQRLIEEQKETNRLMKEQQDEINNMMKEEKERIKNGGLTNSEIVSNSIAQLAIIYIMNKNYQSEISINLKTTIMIMYPIALLICCALLINDTYKKFVPAIIIGVVVIHIYLQFCIYIMEKSYKKNHSKEE